MILKELVDAHEWKIIRKRLRELYPKDARRSMWKFKKSFAILKKLESQESNDGIKLRIDLIKEQHGVWYDVSGEKEGDFLLWGLGFHSWEEWLGMEIHPKTFDICNHLDIVVHCLWEMTFYGFTPEKIKAFKA
ncbi:MAG: DUF6557 family protein [Candidatus Heimdallarchaeota archaeon]